MATYDEVSRILAEGNTEAASAVQHWDSDWSGLYSFIDVFPAICDAQLPKLGEGGNTQYRHSE